MAGSSSDPTANGSIGTLLGGSCAVVARRAGIGKRVGPHTLRHAFITAALDAGVPLRDVQEAASHADPRTTMRYDRGRQSLDRHATYIVATFIAGAARWQPTLRRSVPVHGHEPDAGTQPTTRPERARRDRGSVGQSRRAKSRKRSRTGSVPGNRRSLSSGLPSPGRRPIRRFVRAQRRLELSHVIHDVSSGAVRFRSSAARSLGCFDDHGERTGCRLTVVDRRSRTSYSPGGGGEMMKV